MKFDIRVAFATVALALGACQGGLDSGGAGMPGQMGPPVQQPGPIGTGEMQGPVIGANGQPELEAPGATLAPNEAQYPVGDGPTGMKCPVVALFGCTLSFNMPPPSPSPSPGASGSPKPTPKPTPTPTPTASPSADAGGDDTDSGPTPTPSPPGTITLQMEPLPKDLPNMTNADPRALRITPLMALRLQSDTDFSLNGNAQVVFTMPRQQITGRVFAIQLYNETAIRGKRTDQFLAAYPKFTAPDENTVTFSFTTPKVTVKRGQIWLVGLYGFQYAPGTTPTPSPTPSPTSSASASPAAGASPAPTPTNSP